MIWIKRFILMIQFFTRIPVPVNLHVKEEDFGKGLVFAPAVGGIIGILLAAASLGLTRVLPVGLATAITLLLYILLSGGIHLDGLGDTCDGVFSGRDRGKSLEIMRDSRIGTYALLGVVMVLLIDWSGISAIHTLSVWKVWLLMPVAGRLGSVTGSAFFSYARAGQGLGKAFMDSSQPAHAFLALGYTTLLFSMIYSWTGVLLAGIMFSMHLLAGAVLSRKMKGLTGDMLGFLCETGQSFFVILILIFN